MQTDELLAQVQYLVLLSTVTVSRSICGSACYRYQIFSPRRPALDQVLVFLGRFFEPAVGHRWNLLHT